MSHSTSRTFLSLSSLLKNIDIEWLIPNEISVGINMLIGPKEMGKSTLALDYALRVARDHPVIYLMGDEPLSVKDRCEAWSQFYSIEGSRLHFDFGSLPMIDSDRVKGFADQAALLAPALIVIDPLHLYFPKKSMTAKAADEFIASCATLRRISLASILLVGDSDEEGLSTDVSNSLITGCDSVLSLSYDDKEKKYILRAIKAIAGTDFTPSYLNFAPVELGEGRSSHVVKRSTRRVPKIDDLDGKALELLHILNDAGEKGVPVADVALRINMSLVSAYRIVNILKAKKYAVQTMRGGPVTLTPRGQAVGAKYVQDWSAVLDMTD